MAGTAHLNFGCIFSIREIGCGQQEQRSARALLQKRTYHTAAEAAKTKPEPDLQEGPVGQELRSPPRLPTLAKLAEAGSLCCVRFREWLTFPRSKLASLGDLRTREELGAVQYHREVKTRFLPTPGDRGWGWGASGHPAGNSQKKVMLPDVKRKESTTVGARDGKREASKSGQWAPW